MAIDDDEFSKLDWSWVDNMPTLERIIKNIKGVKVLDVVFSNTHNKVTASVEINLEGTLHDVTFYGFGETKQQAYDDLMDNVLNARSELRGLWEDLYLKEIK